MILVEHAGHPDQKVHGRGAGMRRVGSETSSKGGGTYEPGSLKRITTGAVVARPGHSVSLDAERFTSDAGYRTAALKAYLIDKRDQFAKGGKMGVWDSRSEGGKSVVLDVVEVTTRAKAVKLGKARGEDGIWDNDDKSGGPDGTYVPTGGKTYT